MDDEIQLRSSDVKFLETLKETRNSVIVKVHVHDKICVMKVYHDRGPSKSDPTYREVNLFICESTAYRQMKAKGLCEKGIIPDFYGIIIRIKPTLWPNLYMFINDRLPPNAILIEYIPNLQSINLFNFSKSRLTRLREILGDIHKANVLHGDPMPRNMMVSVGKQDRVLWTDFDSAQTFSEGHLSPRQESWFKDEVEMVDYFVEGLAQDYKEGKLNLTYSYYYDYFK